jgi:hypothetical protein
MELDPVVHGETIIHFACRRRQFNFGLGWEAPSPAARRPPARHLT